MSRDLLELLAILRDDNSSIEEQTQAHADIMARKPAALMMSDYQRMVRNQADYLRRKRQRLQTDSTTE